MHRHRHLGKSPTPQPALALSVPCLQLPLLPSSDRFQLQQIIGQLDHSVGFRHLPLFDLQDTIIRRIDLPFAVLELVSVAGGQEHPFAGAVLGEEILHSESAGRKLFERGWAVNLNTIILLLFS